MASTINAITTGAGGVATTADASGVLQFQSNGTPALTIDTSGYALLGTATTAQGTDYLQIANTGPANIAQFRYQNNTSSAIVKHYKSRGTTLGSFTAVQSGDALSSVYSYGADGTGWVNSAQSVFYVEGSVSTGVVPTSYYMALANSSGAVTTQFGVQSNGNLQFNSGYGSAATAYGCRAWVNFNGTGTVAIRVSGNVSSITDNGTGDYTVNFTTAMPDANYSYNVSNSVGAAFCFPTLNQNSSLGAVAPTTTACRFVLNRYNATTYDDAAYVNVSVFR